MRPPVICHMIASVDGRIKTRCWNLSAEVLAPAIAARLQQRRFVQRLHAYVLIARSPRAP
jgi:riboflavin biosynthesis pyrimidine reductase